MLKRKQTAARQSYGFSCAWCGKAIPDDVELFTVGAKARPDIDLYEREGETLDIYLEREGRGVKAVFVINDSPAKRDGYDLLFVACSERCADELRSSVGQEKEMSGGGHA